MFYAPPNLDSPHFRTGLPWTTDRAEFFDYSFFGMVHRLSLDNQIVPSLFQFGSSHYSSSKIKRAADINMLSHKLVVHYSRNI